MHLLKGVPNGRIPLNSKGVPALSAASPSDAASANVKALRQVLLEGTGPAGVAGTNVCNDCNVVAKLSGMSFIGSATLAALVPLAVAAVGTGPAGVAGT